ncbi:hypothetical protein [Streptomyces sp. NPDC087300]|uniref:hypothetical protein n=1 Tax=Streptomyces sp. NPDC087300 TaxID=3365780 RepID=UPI00380E79D2
MSRQERTSLTAAAARAIEWARTACPSGDDDPLVPMEVVVHPADAAVLDGARQLFTLPVLVSIGAGSGQPLVFVREPWWQYLRVDEAPRGRHPAGG